MVHRDEAAASSGSAITGCGKWTSASERRLGIARRARRGRRPRSPSAATTRDGHRPRVPACAARGIPATSSPGWTSRRSASAPRAHRLLVDDPEDVLAARVDRVAAWCAGHQQHAVVPSGTRHILTGSSAIATSVGGRKNVQDGGTVGVGRVGRMQITAHIVVQGAERAAAFYAEAFGAEEREPHPHARRSSDVGRAGARGEPPAPRRRVPGDGRARAAVDRRDDGRPRARRRDAETRLRAGARRRRRRAPAAGRHVLGRSTRSARGPVRASLEHRQHLRDVPHDEVVAAAAIAFAAGSAS